MLAQEEARELLDSLDASILVGLRDRAIIATMIYTFGRVGAVIKMRVEDYYTQGRRGWVRLHEKGGKRHEMPCNHNLEAYLDAYIAAAGIAEDRKGYLFRSTRGRTRLLTTNPLAQADVYRMILRRAFAAGSRLESGITRSGRRVSLSISAMAVGASLRSRWQRMSRRGRQRFMIVGIMAWRWTRWRGSSFEL